MFRQQMHIVDIIYSTDIPLRCVFGGGLFSDTNPRAHTLVLCVLTTFRRTRWSKTRVVCSLPRTHQSYAHLVCSLPSDNASLAFPGCPNTRRKLKVHFMEVLHALAGRIAGAELPAEEELRIHAKLVKSIPQ
eukprot:scaffold88872_cov21-Tisochrysis_lutea.AAC.1